MSRASIMVSPEYITTLIENVKLMSAQLRSAQDLSITEFSVLSYLALNPLPQSATEIAQRIGVTPRTTRSAAAALMKRNLVEGLPSDQDGRETLYEPTVLGSKLAQEASNGLFIALKSTFWRSIPEEELDAALPDMASFVKPTEIANSQRPAPLDAIPPTFPLGVSNLLESLRKAVAESSEIGMNEYRLLALVASDQMSPSEAADMLYLKRSTVSVAKAHLEEKGFVRESFNRNDSRTVILRATRQGRNELARTDVALHAAMESAHRNCPREQLYMLNAWNVRMFCEMDRAHALLEDLLSKSI